MSTQAVTKVTDTRLLARDKFRRSLVKLQKKMEKEGLYPRGKDEVDQFTGLYGENQLVVPRFAPAKMKRIVMQCDTLLQNINVRIQNVHGFPHTFNFLGEDIKEKDSAEAKRQYAIMDDFFNEANYDEPFIDVRKKASRDYEDIGYETVEVVRNDAGEMWLLNHLPAETMRLTKRQKEPTMITSVIRRNGKEYAQSRPKFFRKFAQVLPTERSITWFKELGDTRLMDSKTGRYVTQEEVAKEGIVTATEIMYRKQDFGGMCYGVPRWISVLLLALGRTGAQFVNYDLLNNQGIPPLLILVSNGTLTDEGWEDLHDMVSSFRGTDQFNRAAVLESQSDSMGLDEKGGAKIEFKSLIEYRKDDAMFEKYDIKTEEGIRRIFRHAPVYTGGTGEFNRATAIASMRACEEQVFIPERDSYDRFIKHNITKKELNVDLWEFKSGSPQLVGPDEILSGLNSFVQAGAISINWAIKLCNKAFGLTISLFEPKWADLPLFIVTALIQQGVVLQGMEGVADTSENAQKTVLGLSGQVPGTALPGVDTPAKPNANGNKANPNDKIMQLVETMKKADFEALVPIIMSNEDFSPEEMEWYKSITALQSAMKASTPKEITDADFEAI
jgi:PBSX family phage portal protein